MALYMEKSDEKAWRYTQSLSDEELFEGIINIIKDTDLDVHEAMVAIAFFKRNNIEFNHKEMYRQIGMDTKQYLLDFGIYEEDLVKIDD